MRKTTHINRVVNTFLKMDIRCNANKLQAVYTAISLSQKWTETFEMSACECIVILCDRAYPLHDFALKYFSEVIL